MHIDVLGLRCVMYQKLFDRYKEFCIMFTLSDGNQVFVYIPMQRVDDIVMVQGIVQTWGTNNAAIEEELRRTAMSEEAREAILLMLRNNRW